MRNAACRRSVGSRGFEVSLAVFGAAGAIFALASFLGRAEPLSAQVKGPLLLLFSEENFGGRCLEVRGTLLDLPREVLEDGSVFDWNDNVRSLKVVSGTWRLCQHGRLNTALDDTELSELVVEEKARSFGWAALVSSGSEGPAEYASAAGWGWAPDVSSVELLSEEALPDWARKPLPGR